jgi:hypothetical protein
MYNRSFHNSDDKGLCLCLNPKKNNLFYAEKVHSGLKILRLDLKHATSNDSASVIQVFEIEEAQIVNMVAIDDSKLFVLFNRNSKAHIRLIDLTKNKYEERSISDQFRSDHMTVSSELGLVVVSCVERTKTGCINHLKCYDISLSKEVGYHQLTVPKPDGNILLKEAMSRSYYLRKQNFGIRQPNILTCCSQ